MNAKTEFLQEVGTKEVLCAHLYFDFISYELEKEINHHFYLKKGYTEADYQAFLNSIDESYDEGFGGQELFGYIWYTDGTWSERYEYDGAEKWDYKSCPKIPNELL